MLFLESDCVHYDTFYACVKFKIEALESGDGSAQVNPRVCGVIEACLRSVKGSTCVQCELI